MRRERGCYLAQIFRILIIAVVFLCCFVMSGYVCAENAGFRSPKNDLAEFSSLLDIKNIPVANQAPYIECSVLTSFDIGNFCVWNKIINYSSHDIRLLRPQKGRTDEFSRERKVEIVRKRYRQNSRLSLVSDFMSWSMAAIDEQRASFKSQVFRPFLKA